MKYLILIILSITTLFSCKDDKKKEIPKSVDYYCDRYVEKEKSISNFLIRRRIIQLNDTCIWNIYKMYYDQFFIKNISDTIYFSYLDLKLSYLTYPFGDSLKSFEFGYSLVDKNCNEMEKEFKNYKKFILDFNASNNRIKIESYVNQMGQTTLEMNNSVKEKTDSNEFRKFLELHFKKISPVLRRQYFKHLK